jgi:hypothetical protein
MMRELFDKYHCDKGSKHHYEIIYEKDFEKLKDDSINILEIGVLHGDSIKVWLEYFPNATIYTVDTFQRVAPEDILVLQDPRVIWNMCDSTSDNAKDLWIDIKFDIIIDDGLHNSVANRLTFLNFFDKLKVGGAYYVEDVMQYNIVTPRDRLKGSYKNTHSNNHYVRNGSISNYNSMLETFRKNGKSVFIYDLREQSDHIDSCIIKITK